MFSNNYLDESKRLQTGQLVRAEPVVWQVAAEQPGRSVSGRSDVVSGRRHQVSDPRSQTDLSDVEWGAFEEDPTVAKVDQTVLVAAPGVLEVVEFGRRLLEVVPVGREVLADAMVAPALPEVGPAAQGLLEDVAVAQVVVDGCLEEQLDGAALLKR